MSRQKEGSTVVIDKCRNREEKSVCWRRRWLSWYRREGSTGDKFCRISDL